MFHTHLRLLYRQAAERWDIYFVMSTVLFANFAWYFLSDENVESMFQQDFAHLLLLVGLAILVYITIFTFLKKASLRRC